MKRIVKALWTIVKCYAYLDVLAWAIVGSGRFLTSHSREWNRHKANDQTMTFEEGYALVESHIDAGLNGWKKFLSEAWTVFTN